MYFNNYNWLSTSYGYRGQRLSSFLSTRILLYTHYYESTGYILMKFGAHLLDIFILCYETITPGDGAMIKLLTTA